MLCQLPTLEWSVHGVYKYIGRFTVYRSILYIVSFCIDWNGYVLFIYKQEIEDKKVLVDRGFISTSKRTLFHTLKICDVLSNNLY